MAGCTLNAPSTEARSMGWLNVRITGEVTGCSSPRSGARVTSTGGRGGRLGVAVGASVAVAATFCGCGGTGRLIVHDAVTMLMMVAATRIARALRWENMGTSQSENLQNVNSQICI